MSHQGAIHIIGCGDIGRRVAHLYLADNIAPIAWVRSHASRLTCRALNTETHQVDFDKVYNIDAISQHSTIWYTVPPPAIGQTDPRLTALLKCLSPKDVQKFVLISTTGVYGDCQGEWVDESTPIHPVVDRALRRADAESAIQNWGGDTGVNFIILRVPGIYAAERLPLSRIERGIPVVRREEAPWTNRIHADDLATACHLALNSPIGDDIINISDDEPSTMTDYFNAVADYAGLPRPPEISLRKAKETLSEGMLSYLNESRRIKNSKMKDLLKIELRYPTLEEGLA